MSRGAEPRRALVTGAGRGLGRALTRQLVAAGWEVLAAVRDPGRADLPEAAQVLPLDQSDPQSIRTLAARLKGVGINLILHNAAIRGDTGGLASFSQDDFLQVMAVNVAGPLLLTQALMANLRPGAKVAFISSRAGSMAEGADLDGDYAYCCSKAALNRALVKLSGDFPQTFLGIHPGWVRTEMGGAEADLQPDVSAAGILAQITAATAADSGSFRAWDGAKVDW